MVAQKAPHGVTVVTVVTVALPPGLIFVTPSSALYLALLSTRTPGKSISAGFVWLCSIQKCVFSPFGWLLCHAAYETYAGWHSAVVFTNQPLSARTSREAMAQAISWISSLSVHNWTDPRWCSFLKKRKKKRKWSLHSGAHRDFSSFVSLALTKIFGQTYYLLDWQCNWFVY